MKRKIRPVLFSIFALLTLGLTYGQKPGMYVNGRYLYTNSGEKVILKGFNAMIVYWDIHGNVNFPEMEKTGANTCRIFWNLAYPSPQPSDLDLVLSNCIKYKMIPIICLWDATGKWDQLQTCVNYWCSPIISVILKKYEKNLLVNIANEPGDKAMGDAIFKEKYAGIVKQMRTANIHTPLIIDADQYGRNADAVLDNGQYLLEQDPDHNLIFSWHLWDPNNWGSGTKTEIDRIINKAVEKNICFIAGEFGPCEQCDNCGSTLINWEYLIEKAYKNDIGYLAWVWKWSDCHAVVSNSTGKYGSWASSTWGEKIAISHTYSIKNTSIRPSNPQTNIENISSGSHSIVAYPNPSNGEIHFDLTLTEQSEVEVKIIDLMGNDVYVLVHKSLLDGLVHVSWNQKKEQMAGCPGIYFYLAKISNTKGIFSESGKLCIY
jgi:mannan endo-1,4-beta-mannosidase